MVLKQSSSAAPHKKNHLLGDGRYSSLPVMKSSLVSSGNISSLVNRIKLVVLSPRECWSTISAEPADPQKLFKGMVLPLIVVGAVARILGLQVFGVNFGPLGTWRPSLLSSLSAEISVALIQTVLFFVAVALIQRLAQFFSGNATRERATSLVAHAMLPSLVAGILGILPLLGLLGIILGIVGLYAFYQGVSVMTSVTEQHRLGFTASFIGIMILVSMVVYWVTFAMVPFPAPPLQ